jgi:transposase
VLDREIAERAKNDALVQRLMTIPGVGAITATALAALKPPMETFSRGRDFAAWLGLVPRQHSSGGKDRLGKTARMGERSLRRLLVTGAAGVVRWSVRKPPRPDSWLGRMLARKPWRLVAVALAGKMARIVWALITKEENDRALSVAAA